MYWGIDLGNAGMISQLSVQNDPNSVLSSQVKKVLTLRGSGPEGEIISPDYANARDVLMAYNSRGEVSSVRRRRGYSGSVQPVLVSGGAAGYSYDGIGNRYTTSVSKLGATDAQAQTQSEAKQTTSYVTNSRNQYSSITRENPLLKLMQGVMNTQSTVKIDLRVGTVWQTAATFGPGQSTFVTELAEQVNAGAQWRQVRVQATRPGAGLNGAAITATREGWLYYPPQNETLIHDNDGNLTEDARWLYTWDAENRLITMEEKVINGGGPARKRLEFTYDHQSRRVRKAVYQRSSTNEAPGTTWVLKKDRRFIYDGWNMIAEIDTHTTTGTLDLFRSYAWGHDLSGTAQGAGSVGGLLMIQERNLRFRNQGVQNLYCGPGAAAVYAPYYDLNGNILAYHEINRGEGITHHFEYDAFGQELTADNVVDWISECEAIVR